MADQMWQVNVAFTEHGDRTSADATLELADGRFHDFGRAKRAPGDPNLPVTGQHLAAARALSELPPAAQRGGRAARGVREPRGQGRVPAGRGAA